jgi:MFS family permease
MSHNEPVSESTNPYRPPQSQLGQSIVKDTKFEIQNTPAEIRGNFLKVAAFQIVLRTGWIFKTESIVMPAVMDSIAGAGWLRGILPVLNRFGQSIPPLLAAGAVTQTPLKKRILSAAAAVMGGSFLMLAFIWAWTDGQASWLPLAFLCFYGLFFVAVGILNLVLSTLIGKVVRTDRRGRLMLSANIGGASCAVVCAWFLLKAWITPENGNFTNIFAFAGSAFMVAAVLALFLKESPDDSNPESFSPRRIFRDAFNTLRDDHNFRLLAIVGSLFGLSLALFPHYQALGRQQLKVGLDSLVPWLIAQNLGVACFSLPAGWLADRFGNRLVLRCLLAGLCLAPILALVLASQGESAQAYFLWVFVLLGLTPVSFRTFSNYTLELSGRDHQPRYLSTLSLCIAVPTMLLSSLLGLSVDYFGFVPVFVLVILCLLVAWLLTMKLREPRYSSE